MIASLKTDKRGGGSVIRLISPGGKNRREKVEVDTGDSGLRVLSEREHMPIP